jgi:hypothetical protein
MDLHDFFFSSIVENLQEMKFIPKKKDLTFWIILLPLCYFKDIEFQKKIVFTLLDGFFKNICAPMFSSFEKTMK